ncbi:unnamed protein product, partial [Mesorhabditis belari]|uniref:Uncharacterized protein n=1 Tax=Mesorhabditis belari TaxID=2138241 RepID=A0AAF3FAD7_9BILA
MFKNFRDLCNSFPAHFAIAPDRKKNTGKPQSADSGPTATEASPPTTTESSPPTATKASPRRRSNKQEKLSLERR